MSDSSNQFSEAIMLTLKKRREQVRLRPGMYVGNVDTYGLHNIFTTLIDNAIHEAELGSCTDITVSWHSSLSITVDDNGRGNTLDLLHRENCLVGEPTYTELISSDHYGIDGLILPWNQRRVGLSSINPLCTSLVAEVYREGHHYKMAFAEGIPVTPLLYLGTEDRHGTTITITADQTVFDASAHFRPDAICEYLRRLAFLHPGLTCRFQNTATDDHISYCYPGGIAEALEGYSQHRNPYHPPIYESRESDGVRAEFGMQLTVERGTQILAFVNNDPICVGSHLNGFYAGLRQAFTAFARDQGTLDAGENDLTEEEVSARLTMVIAVSLAEPLFSSWDDKLLNVAVKDLVESLVKGIVTDWLERNKELAQHILWQMISKRVSH